MTSVASVVVVMGRHMNWGDVILMFHYKYQRRMHYCSMGRVFRRCLTLAEIEMTWIYRICDELRKKYRISKQSIGPESFQVHHVSDSRTKWRIILPALINVIIGIHTREVCPCLSLHRRNHRFVRLARLYVSSVGS